MAIADSYDNCNDINAIIKIIQWDNADKYNNHKDNDFDNNDIDFNDKGIDFKDKCIDFKDKGIDFNGYDNGYNDNG